MCSSRDPGAKVVARATARRRPTVAMALTINLALTLKRRQHITRFVAEFIADSRLTDEVMDALHPAMTCGHLMCSINGCTTLACLRYQEIALFLLQRTLEFDGELCREGFYEVH